MVSRIIPSNYRRPIELRADVDSPSEKKRSANIFLAFQQSLDSLTSTVGAASL
jgi:hypothetical protein